MRSVYVAGASAEVDRIAGYMRELRLAGLQITHDWTIAVDEQRRRGSTDRNLSAPARALAGAWDLEGVTRADVLWLVVPEVPSSGCWVELGAALVSGRMVIVSGDHQRTIFSELAQLRFDVHDEALRWFRTNAEGWEGAAE